MTSHPTILHRMAAAGIASCMMAATATHADSDLEQARTHFSDYHYAAGLAPLHKAAETGDREARRTLGLMLLYGESLYPSEVRADSQQGMHWLRLAATDGCEVSRHVLNRLDRPAR